MVVEQNEWMQRKVQAILPWPLRVIPLRLTVRTTVCSKFILFLQKKKKKLKEK